MLYCTLHRQWRTDFNGAAGLDLNVFIPVIERKGWDLGLSLALLEAIEDAELEDRE